MNTARRVLGTVAVTGLGVAAAPAAGAASRVSEAVPDVIPPNVVDGLTAMPLYPLAGGPLDLLSNNIVIPVGGMRVSTFPVTAPLKDGLPLRNVPGVKSLLA